MRATITTSTNHTKEQQNENLPRYLLQYGRRIPRLRKGASPHQFKGQNSSLHILYLFLGVQNFGARVSGFLTWQFAFTTNTTPKGARPATTNTSKRRGSRNWSRRRVSADTAKQHSVRLTPAQKADKAQKNCSAGRAGYG